MYVYTSIPWIVWFLLINNTKLDRSKYRIYTWQNICIYMYTHQVNSKFTTWRVKDRSLIIFHGFSIFFVNFWVFFFMRMRWGVFFLISKTWTIQFYIWEKLNLNIKLHKFEYEMKLDRLFNSGLSSR